MGCGGVVVSVSLLATVVFQQALIRIRWLTGAMGRTSIMASFRTSGGASVAFGPLTLPTQTPGHLQSRLFYAGVLQM
jgi:hypothetical protein